MGDPEPVVKGAAGSNAAAGLVSRPAPVVEEADNPITPCDYVFVDHLRLVQPYYFDFKCNVKKRWYGKRLVDMFAEEFPLLTHEYYHRAFNAGRLRVESVSGKPLKGPAMTLQSPLKDGMCVRHLVHRHEPPVLAGDVQVLEITPDWVAVSKPACMPVHTAGQYRKNTVLGVLQAHHPELGTLYPTYRLDKPVSGLLVLARSSVAAGRMRQTLEERTCEKVYVARVQGRFPASADELSSTRTAGTDAHVKVVDGMAWGDMPAPVHVVQGTAAATDTGQQLLQSGSNDACAHSELLPNAVEGRLVPGDGVGSGQACDGTPIVIQVDVPLRWSAQHNHGTAAPMEGPLQGGIAAGDTARPATTQFRLLSTSPDGSLSLVECRPLTGRTHQIRIHLQYMGFPIANDTQYGGTWGRPLAFRKLRQAQQQQQGAPTTDHQQHEPPPDLQDHDMPLGSTDSNCYNQLESSSSGLPLKRTWVTAAGDSVAQGQAPVPAIHQPSTEDDADMSFHDAKRQAMITAFTQPHMVRDSTIPVHSTQLGTSSNRTNSRGASVASVAEVGATSGQVGGVELMNDASNKRAALLHAAVASGLGGPLPPELHTLYHEARYRVRPEQEEEVSLEL